MNVRHIAPVFEDDRGVITDIIEHTPCDSVAIISCVKGAIRGNHYHKESVQFTYVMSGKILALSQVPHESVEARELTEGDLMESPPLERHALHALEDSLLLVITRGPRGGKQYEDDTYRIDPLQSPAD